MKRKTTSEVSDNSTLENQNIVVLFLKTAKNSSRYPNNWSTVQLSKIRPYFAKLIDRCAGLRHISPIGCSVHPVAVSYQMPPCQLCLKGASLARCCSSLLFVVFLPLGVAGFDSRAKLAVWWPRVPVDSVRNSSLATGATKYKKHQRSTQYH